MADFFAELWAWRHERDIAARIRKHGWTAIHLGDYETQLTWCYSLGFTESLGQPEIVIFDIPPADANRLLWTIFGEMRECGLQPEDGALWPGEPGDPAPAWRKVHPSRITGQGWFSFAARRQAKRTGRAEDLQVFQLVLPDREGKLPWDTGYNESIRDRQPALYEPLASDPALAGKPWL